MTARERARRALRFQSTDRPVRDLGSTRVSGVAAWVYRALRRFLCLPSIQPRVYDLSQFLAEVDDDVLDALGCDFLMLPNQILPLELKRGGWKSFTFWDGSTYLVPEQFHPQWLPDGTLIHGHGFPWSEPARRMPPGCRYFERLHYPDLTSIHDEVPHLPESRWQLPEPFDDEALRHERENARRLFKETDRALVSSTILGVPAGYSGPIGWAIKLRTAPDHARAYMMAEADALARRARQYLQQVGEFLDVVMISGVDFGTQKGELFAPALFGEFFVPAWEIVTRAIHETSPHVKIFVHTCGSVRGILPYLVEAGVDIYNPVQWSADGMDRKRLARELGGRIVFWGGGANSQHTLPFGTPASVRREAEESLEIFGKKGGYILAPTHNVQADVPPENLVSLYAAGS
jgi:uroporphyrinogen decarboxylase